MNLLRLIAANPKLTAKLVGSIILMAMLGLQIIRAERAERKLAEAMSISAADRGQLDACIGDRDGYRAQLQSYADAAAQETERRIKAEKEARRVRIVTVERVKEIREAAIPSDCTAAIEYGATQAPIIAEWGKAL